MWRRGATTILQDKLGAARDPHVVCRPMTKWKAKLAPGIWSLDKVVRCGCGAV